VKTIALFLLPLALLPGPQSPLRGQADVEAEIRSVLQEYIRATNAGDIERLAALYLNSPTTGSIGDGSIYRGWATVADLLRGIYSQFGRVELRETDLVITPLGADAALAYFMADWRLGTAPPIRYRGAMTLVFLRTPQGWRVAHDHTSTLPGSTVVEGVPSQTPFQLSGGPAAPVREPESCVVTRIVDGDTIDCAPFGRVRLIGMDTPEGGQQPFGDMATEALTHLIPAGTDVLLEPDVEARDRYDRLLGYVWADGILVNWALVRQGFAVLLTYPPNVQYVEWLTEAQTAAREESLGLWAIDGFACPPSEFRRGRCRLREPEDARFGEVEGAAAAR
jgi:micrococcal nuclease